MQSSPSTPPQEPSIGQASRKQHTPLLLVCVLIIATCGLVYELLAGTLASYLLGDSVTQFSTIIGVYLSAMGLGSFLSKYIQRGLAYRFVDIELAVALVGGCSAPALFLAFASTKHFQVLLYGIVLIIGILVGLEIPLLLRILRHEFAFKDLVAHVLTFDYIGALVASILFPVILVPRLGLVRTSFLFGALNAAVGLWSTYLLRPQLGDVRLLRTRCLLAIGLLLGGLFIGDRFTKWMEDDIYADNIVFAKTTPYQRIVLTKSGDRFQLFLNGSLQFSSLDEYRYHEALVHPAFSVNPEVHNVLICGGGDGLALREILRYQSVRAVTLVDLDPAITTLATSMPVLRALNEDSMHDPRVTVINADAMIWLSENETQLAAPSGTTKQRDTMSTTTQADSSSTTRRTDPFDLVVVDFPDPNNFSLGKLYTTRFYKMLRRNLAPGGVVVVQSTSPLFARRSFWCIAHTMEAAGFSVHPYHLAVPSFGVWGYVLAALEPFEIPRSTRPDLRFLDPEAMQAMFVFPKDMAPLETEVNRLNNQVLVEYYEREWRKWN